MKIPAVTVVIPVYNCGRYVERAVSSILNQSLIDIEIIAVDDGSTDGSGDTLDAMATSDKRLQVEHLPNSGIVVALNHGLSLARGTYLARMDGDDIAWPDRLEKQFKFLNSHPDCVAVGSLYRLIDDTDTVLHVQRPTSQNRQTDLKIFPPFVKTVPHPTLMVRTDAMQMLGGYRPYFPHAEDHDLFLRLAQIGTIELLGEPMLDYRVHAHAVSERHRDTQLDSKVLAQMAAVVAMRTGVDPLCEGEIGSIERSLFSMPGLPSATSWELLRALYRIDHDLNRRDLANTQRELASVVLQTAANWRALQRDGTLLGILRYAAKCAARIGAILVRG